MTDVVTTSPTTDAHLSRLVATLEAFPAGYTASADGAAHYLVRVRADDLRQALGDLHAYRETMRIIAQECA
jgi:hypothetical protein